MSDSYQAIYDAVRSRISNGDIGAAIAEVARSQFDISYAAQNVQETFRYVAHEYQRPFILLRPKMFPDGYQWCALYGDNIHDGVAGFGDTPAKAAEAFDLAWLNETAKAKGAGK